MTINQVKLSESQRALLSTALHIAMATFDKSTTVALGHNEDTLAAQFIRQHNDASVLAQLIEDAESVVIDKGD